MDEGVRLRLRLSLSLSHAVAESFFGVVNRSDIVHELLLCQEPSYVF